MGDEMWIWTIIGHYHNTGRLVWQLKERSELGAADMKTGPATGDVDAIFTIFALLKAPTHK